MGFRSTLCSQHYPGELPEWFKNRYDQIMLFPDGLLVVSRMEAKFYDNQFFEDYQKALREIGFFDNRKCPMIVMVLAEDGNATRVYIGPSVIAYSWVSDDVDLDCVYYPGHA